MPSAIYKLFHRAIIGRKQIVCLYNGKRRELCPIILGHTKGEEKALVYQFAGESGRPLPSPGNWRCLTLAEVSDAKLRDGPWHAGESHSTRQTCVADVDIDVNPDSPYVGKSRRIHSNDN